MRESVRAYLLVLLGAAAGCAAAPVSPWAGRGPVLPYRLLIATPEVSAQKEKRNPNPTRRFHTEADPTSLQAALREGFEWAELFEDVDLLSSAEKGRDPIENAARAGVDLLLETRVRKRVASYEGRNILFLPNLLVWGYTVLPSWWVPDEKYALELEVEVDLRSVRSGLIVYSGIHRVRVEEALNDFERGWQFLGIFRVPGSLDGENWVSVDASLSPATEAKLARQVASEAGREILAGADTPKSHRAFASRFAVVVGVSHFEDQRIQGVRFADADARAFHGHLLRRVGVPSYNTRLLLNGRATLARIRSAIEEFVALGVGEDDEVFIYLAGYGAWTGERAYFLPYDADSERLEATALALDELAAPSYGLAGPRVTLIIDAPLVGRFAGRSMGDESTGSIEDALAGFLSEAEHRILTSGEIGQGCVELDDLGRGLFNFYLIGGLEGDGDRDRDGKVTWEEAHAYAQWRVEDHAPLEGTVQVPRLYRGPHPEVPGNEEVQQ
ncbi:MAG: caspase family protein [Planctomycetota bacterium]|nr:caspase family protein [Planctomycetota bacterium]